MSNIVWPKLTEQKEPDEHLIPPPIKCVRKKRCSLDFKHSWSSFQDWNSFLTNFDNIEFCVDTNSVMKSSDVMKNISVTTTGITTGEGDEDLLASIRQSYLSKSVCLKVDTNVRPSKAVDQDTTLLRGVHHVLFKLAANSFGIQGRSKLSLLVICL